MRFMDARTLKFMDKAMEYSQCKVLADKEALAFLAGAKWADENPEWIDDRVPEKIQDSAYSENVLFIAENFQAERPYCTVYVGKYCQYSCRWVLTDGNLLPKDTRVICWKSIKLPSHHGMTF